MRYIYLKLSLTFRSQTYECLVRIKSEEEQILLTNDAVVDIVQKKYQTMVVPAEISYTTKALTEAEYMSNTELERHRVTYVAPVVV